MVPSTGIEPVTFPMSRERATAAPTGPKSILHYTIFDLMSEFETAYNYCEGGVPIINVQIKYNVSIVRAEQGGI